MGKKPQDFLPWKTRIFCAYKELDTAAQPHAEKAAPWLFPGSNPPSHIPGNASTAPSRGQGQNSPVSRDPPPSGAAAASGESPSSSPIPLLVLEGRGAALVSTPWFFITAFPPSQTLQKQKGSDFKDIWRILGVISPGWEGACSRQELCAEESIAWFPSLCQDNSYSSCGELGSPPGTRQHLPAHR